MSTPQLVPADGDPPEDPAAAESPVALGDEGRDAETQGTENPLPESLPSSRNAAPNT